jgi:hypothetical protein
VSEKLHASAILSGGVDPFGQTLSIVRENLDDRSVYENVQLQ